MKLTPKISATNVGEFRMMSGEPGYIYLKVVHKVKAKIVYITTALNVFEDTMFGIGLGKSTFKHMCYFVFTDRYLGTHIVFNAPLLNNAHKVYIRNTKPT